MDFEGTDCLDTDSDTCTASVAYEDDCTSTVYGHCPLAGSGANLKSGFTVGGGAGASMEFLGDCADTVKVTADFKLFFPEDLGNSSSPVVAGLTDTNNDEIFTFQWQPSTERIHFRCGSGGSVVTSHTWLSGLSDNKPYNVRLNFDGATTTCTYYIDTEFNDWGAGGEMNNASNPLVSGQSTTVSGFFHTESYGGEAVGSIVDDIGICDATNGFLVQGVKCGSALPTPTPTATPVVLDFDGDLVPDGSDNCSRQKNPGQDDTDGDDCGNACDTDYDNTGLSGLVDFGEFTSAFLTTEAEKCHVEPITGCTVGHPDFGVFVSRFLNAPGPSGTTAGTTACP